MRERAVGAPSLGGSNASDVAAHYRAKPRVVRLAPGKNPSLGCCGQRCGKFYIPQYSLTCVQGSWLALVANVL